MKIAELRKLRAEESAFSTIPFENGKNAPAEIREVFNTVVSSNLRWLTTQLDEIYLLMEAEKIPNAQRKKPKTKVLGALVIFFSALGNAEVYNEGHGGKAPLHTPKSLETYPPVCDVEWRKLL